MVQYRFALNEENQVIDIDKVIIGDKNTFICLGCEQPLIAKKGPIRVHHFAHKHNDLHCSLETYLHKLGKKYFEELFLNSKKTNTPLIIQHNMRCNYKERFSLLRGLEHTTCNNIYVKRINLISEFDDIFIEKRDGVLIPDLMLINHTSGDKIYIEIKVKHPCSEEKLNSKIKIMEFQISNEMDLEKINRQNFIESETETQFFNLYNFNKILSTEESNDCYCANQMAGISIIKAKGHVRFTCKQLKNIPDYLSIINKIRYYKIIYTGDKYSIREIANVFF